MTKWFLVFVAALTLLVSSDALVAPALSSEIKPMSVSDVNQATQVNMNSKRSLRGLKTTDNAADEERIGVPGLVQKMETVVAKANPVQLIQNVKLARAAKREAEVKELVKSGANFEALSKEHVTVDEFFMALDIPKADLEYKFLALKSPNLIRVGRYRGYLTNEAMNTGFLKTKRRY